MKWFDETTEFGFVRPDEDNTGFFANYSSVEATSFRMLKEVQPVEDQVEQEQKGSQALDMKPLG